jgi:hypothetical protein
VIVATTHSIKTIATRSKAFAQQHQPGTKVNRDRRYQAIAVLGRRSADWERMTTEAQTGIK